VASATVDPRQSALFGAAYAVAAAAQAAASGVETLTLAAPTGPFGIINSDGSPRPIKAIAAELSSAAGLEGQPLRTSAFDVYGVSYGRRALIANLSGSSVSLALPNGLGKASTLEIGATWSLPLSDRLNLAPYRVALLSA
jgi:hypothetical protein